MSIQRAFTRLEAYTSNGFRVSILCKRRGDRLAGVEGEELDFAVIRGYICVSGFDLRAGGKCTYRLRRD